jgi:hypothetical protein
LHESKNASISQVIAAINEKRAHQQDESVGESKTDGSLLAFLGLSILRAKPVPRRQISLPI